MFSEISESHDSVGASSYLYLSPRESALGMCRNVATFNIQWGDSPLRKEAERLMPRAHFVGTVVAVAALSGEVPLSDSPPPNCELHTRRFRVPVFLFVESPEQLKQECRAIGGLAPIPAPRLTWWARCKLRLTYYWLRRPTVTMRSPV